MHFLIDGQRRYKNCISILRTKKLNARYRKRPLVQWFV